MKKDSNRQMISVFKGLAPLSFPAEWLENFDMKNGFAVLNKKEEAAIRFPGIGAFAISVTHDGPRVIRNCRRLEKEEEKKIKWGSFCPPFEAYETCKLFGHGEPICLEHYR